MNIQLILGMVLGALVALLAYRAGALDLSGAAGAAITGGLVFGLGGLPWAALLLAFFVSSSFLSRTSASRKAELSEKFSKGHRRDLAQVLANGGLGAALAILHSLFPEAFWPWLAFAGAMAAVNADTWATELGVLSPVPPRELTTWNVVERGASGGVSPLGSLAALSGAALIGLTAAIFTNSGFPAVIMLMAVTTGGLAGAFFDSLLGASIQGIYYCPVCRKETERHPVHICGTVTNQIRGWSWLNNDWVNGISSLVGALAAVLIGILAV